MKRSTSRRRSLPGFWIILGLMFTATVGMALVLLSLTSESAPPPATLPPTVTPSSPTPVMSTIPSPTAPQSVQATATPLMKPPTLTPAPGPEVPDVAPDFTLNRVNGGTFTLKDQLKEGPVVLVFFERCG